MKFYCYNEPSKKCAVQCESCYIVQDEKNVQIEISLSVVQWLNRDVFDVILQMCLSRKKIYSKGDADYWNAVIVEYAMKEVVKKFVKKHNVKALVVKINLTQAEAYTLYRWLFNFPIGEKFHWKLMNRQYIVNQLHKQLTEFQ